MHSKSDETVTIKGRSSKGSGDKLAYAFFGCLGCSFMLAIVLFVVIILAAVAMPRLMDVPSAAKKAAAETTLIPKEFKDWYHNAPGYQKAKQKARREHKPLLLLFYRPWSKATTDFHREVLSHLKVKQQLDSSFVLVAVNREASNVEKELGYRFEVTTYPTLLVEVLHREHRRNRRAKPEVTLVYHPAEQKHMSALKLLRRLKSFH